MAVQNKDKYQLKFLYIREKTIKIPLFFISASATNAPFYKCGVLKTCVEKMLYNDMFKAFI